MPTTNSKRFRWPLFFNLSFTALMLASFGWMAYNYFFSSTSQLPAYAFPVFVTAVLFVLGERINGAIALQAGIDRDEKVSDAIKKLDVALLNLCSSGIVHIGGSQQGLLHLIEALNGNAKHVKDTLFRVSINTTYRKAPYYKHYGPALESFLAAGGTYTIISNPAGIRHSYVEDKIDQYAKSVNLFYKSIDTTLPLTNMVIIEYESSKEVLFGWDYAPDHSGPVFYSKNAQLIGYFEDLWDLLAHASIVMPDKSVKVGHN